MMNAEKRSGTLQVQSNFAAVHYFFQEKEKRGNGNQTKQFDIKLETSTDFWRVLTLAVVATMRGICCMIQQLASVHRRPCIDMLDIFGPK